MPEELTELQLHRARGSPCMQGFCLEKATGLETSVCAAGEFKGKPMRKRKIICWVQGSMLSTRIPSDDWWKHHPFSFDIRTYTAYSNQILGNWKNHAKCNNASYFFLQRKVNKTYRDQIGGIHSNYQASLQIVSFGFFPKTGAQFMLNLGKHCKI